MIKCNVSVKWSGVFVAFFFIWGEEKVGANSANSNKSWDS